MSIDKTELNLTFTSNLKHNILVEGNKKNNNTIRNKIFEQICELQRQIAETDDSMALGNVHEEIQLLNNFLRYSKQASNSSEMIIDSKMMKKQKMQRSWYK